MSDEAAKLSGILLVDKPAGLTSHDVVARVRRAARRVRTGHAGTLDPFATGLLVVCLGSATRLTEWATGHEKRYLADVAFGRTTSTLDVTGETIEERACTVEKGELLSVLARFQGEIDQQPPAFSAIQVGGRRLYDLARQGIAVEPPIRRVHIVKLDLLTLDDAVARIDVTCSKGTYVRALARDIGEAIGCGAHLSALRRIMSGPFDIDLAHSLDEVTAAAVAGKLHEILLPPAAAVDELPRLSLSESEVMELRFGRPIRPLIDDPHSEAPAESMLAAPTGTEPSLARAHAPDDDLVAIVEWRDLKWWPMKVFST